MLAKKVQIFSVMILFVLLSSSLVVIVESSVIWSQTYQKLGGQGISSMIETSDNGFAFVGSTQGDVWLVKTDSLGNLQWNKTYGGKEQDIVHSLVAVSDGGFALAGYTESFDADGFDFWLLKTDNDGNVEWNQTYGQPYNDFAYSMVETSDGGYALGGYTLSLVGNLEDYLLVKTDSSGNIQWQRTYGGEDRDYAYSVIETSDGGFALAGYSGHSNSVFWLIKADSVGNMEWNQTYGDETLNRAYSIVETPDRGYVLAGKKSSNAGVSIDFSLVKTDVTGNILWEKTYGKTILGWGGYPLIKTSDGGFAFASYVFNETTGTDCWFVKTDNNGNLIWNQTYTLENNQGIGSLIETSDGGFALGGSTELFDIEGDFWLIKTDLNGIPEFPSWTPLLSTLVALVTVAMIYRRRLHNQNQRGKKVKF